MWIPKLAVTALALMMSCAAAAAPGEMPRFAGYRALVLASAEVWQEGAAAIYGALEERGFTVEYRENLNLLPGDGFDLIAISAERPLSGAEEDALTQFVETGGAVYMSWDQPYSWGRGAAPGAPRFVREVGKVAAARAANIHEFVVTAGAFSQDLPTLRSPLKQHVGCFKATGWTTIALEPGSGAQTIATDERGAVLGLVSEHGKGRTAVMGFPPEQEKYLEDAELCPRLLDNLLAWLMADKLRREPAPLGVVSVAVPARAQVTGVYVDDHAVSDPQIQQVGSLQRVRLDTSAWPAGQARQVRITYRPLIAGRNVETMLHMPWGVLRGAADSPEALAEHLTSLGVNICQPLLRSSAGKAWYKGMPDDSPDDKLVTDYQGNFLEDMVRACHARGIKVVGGIYFDNVTPIRRDPSVKRINRQGQPVRDAYGVFSACFNNPKGREYNLATIEHLLANYRLDGIVLDDNYWLDYSDMYACYCDYCKDDFKRWCEARGETYVDPAMADNGPAAELWWEYKRQATRSLAAQVREIAERHGVPAGGYVNPGIGMTHLAGSFDCLYEMDYSSPPRSMRGILSQMGKHPLTCLLWEPNVSGEQLEREVREAIHAGCATVGFWTGAIAEDYKAPPEKFEAMKRALTSVEQEWRIFYQANLISGDTRFSVSSAKAGPQELRLTLTHTGGRAPRRMQEPLDLSSLP